ncbi:hypothetical protein [Glaciimonas sp. PAMC28666]|uniref:hypothetical protein n=1 Tax=Glaciimonas sp. PAMC28666 TaxID=2807626 RepID=UPI001962862C|nr:hypothetical protein [Glaciimonas sp. PAMC28666]QRX82739.1 hypothetical protein JQN73_22280 [Glaciimonas sp. PAMC28666]
MKLPLSVATIIARKFCTTYSLPEKYHSNADMVVKNAPPPPKLEPTPTPRTGLIWIPGMWQYVEGWYAWQAGSWELNREGQHYVHAQWLQSPKGWQLTLGHWMQSAEEKLPVDVDNKSSAAIPYDPLAAYR